QFKKTGLTPLGNNKTYIQEFEVKEGREIKNETTLSIEGKSQMVNADYFPLAYSGNVSALTFSDGSDKAIVYYNLNNVIEENKTNPHFDLKENIYTAAKKADADGKKIFIIYNSSTDKDDMAFDAKDKTEILKIPVIYYGNHSPIKSGF